MSVTDQPGRPAARLDWRGAVAGVSILSIAFVFVAVNACIYWARAAFIAAHPAYAAQTPPTISRALADPAIAAPFAFWVAVAAALLVLGVGGIVVMAASALPGLERAAPGPGRRVWLAVLAVWPLQLGASVGMVMLSRYTFPDHDEMHMAGSYLFFAAQAATVLCGLVVSLAARDPAVAARMQAAGALAPRANRLRVYLGALCIALVLGYLALFVLKDLDLGAWEPAVYQTYVLTEPLCISGFLLFVLLYLPDLARYRRHRRALAKA
jgi:hypothetical protein